MITYHYELFFLLVNFLGNYICMHYILYIHMYILYMHTCTHICCVFWLYLAPMWSSPHLLLAPSYPYAHYPSYSPVSSPDTRHLIFTFVLWFRLAVAIFATTGLGLPMGTWWGHQWVHNWRQWIILLLNLFVVNSSRVGDGSPQALLLQTIQRPFLMRTQCGGCCCEFHPWGWVFPRGRLLLPSSVF